MNSIKNQPLYLKDFDSSFIYKYQTHLASLAKEEAFHLLHETQKGHALFKDKFVADIRFNETDEGGFEVQLKVRAEMRKNVTYINKVEISQANEVMSCSCSCPAGKVPASCKHIFASLHALVDYSTKQLYLASTERLQAWHKPKPAKLSPKPFKQVFGRSNPLVARRKLNYNALFQGSQPLQFLSVLRDSDAIADNHTIPLPACILSGRPASPFSKLNLSEFLFINEYLKFHLEDVWEMERETRDQSDSALWKNERKVRLTSYNFFEICHRKADKNALAAKLYEPRDISHVPAVKYGKDNEAHIRNIIRQSYPAYILRKVGLVCNPFFPHLGASPDGLLSNKEDVFLLEIKSIFNPSYLDLETLAAERPSFCLERKGDKWVLKKSHQYFYQVQGQLAIANLQKCLFVVFWKKPNHVKMCFVDFDEQFWSYMYSKLHDFYRNYYLPFLLSKAS